MTIDDSLVNEIVSRVLSVADAEKIIIFGSAVKGEMTRDSDIDLLVLESAPENSREESVRIGDALRGLGVPIDVLVMSRQRFEETHNVIGGIAYPAHREGRVIFEAA
jgi:predicted nucleotidyltransferase